ncbi:MAG: PEGA domain-containing protein [Candidatus Methylomirabilales bacterium]
MRRIRMMLGLVGLGLFWGGCASTMMVFTEPGNAEILVNGETIGQSPLLYAGEAGVGGAVEVTARLRGYEETTKQVSRVLRPWGWYLPDDVHIRLEPVGE